MAQIVREGRRSYLRFVTVWVWAFTCGLVAVDGPPLSTFTMGVLATPLLRRGRLPWLWFLAVVAALAAGVIVELADGVAVVALRLGVFAVLGAAWGRRFVRRPRRIGGRLPWLLVLDAIPSYSALRWVTMSFGTETMAPTARASTMLVAERASPWRSWPVGLPGTSPP